MSSGRDVDVDKETMEGSRPQHLPPFRTAVLFSGMLDFVCMPYGQDSKLRNSKIICYMIIISWCPAHLGSLASWLKRSLHEEQVTSWQQSCSTDPTWALFGGLRGAVMLGDLGAIGSANMPTCLQRYGCESIMIYI